MHKVGSIGCYGHRNGVMTNRRSKVDKNFTERSLDITAVLQNQFLPSTINCCIILHEHTICPFVALRRRHKSSPCSMSYV